MSACASASLRARERGTPVTGHPQHASATAARSPSSGPSRPCPVPSGWTEPRRILDGSRRTSGGRLDRPRPLGSHRHEHRHPVRFAPSWAPPTDRHPPPTGGGANRTGDGARAVPGDGPELGKGPNRRTGGKTGPDPGIRVEPGTEPGAAPTRHPAAVPPGEGPAPGSTLPSSHPHAPIKGLDLPGSGTRNTGSRGGNPDTSCQATPHRRQDNRPGTSARLPVSQPRPSPHRHALATSAPRYAKGRQLSLTQSMHCFMSERSSAKYPCHGSSSRNHAAGCPPSGLSGVLGSTIAMKDTPMTAGQSGR